MTPPAYLIGAQLRHPTNPNVRMLHIQDNPSALWILQNFNPEWIEHLPLAVSAQTPDKCNIITSRHYDKRARRGVCATYFGAGCKADDSGWDLLCVSQANEEEFNTAVEVFQAILLFSIRAQNQAEK
jgi:hypothetical protein